MPILKGRRANGHPIALTLPAAPSVATSYTMTQSAATGTTGTGDTFTFAPVGGNWPSATITIAVSGVTAALANGSGGTLSGSVLTVPSGTTTSCTVTMTPSTAGTATISATNSAGLTNPGSLTYTVTSATAPSQVGSLAPVTASITSSTIPVTYTAASGTATITYTGYTSPHGAGTWTLNAGSFSGTGGTFTGLAASTSYDLRIVATNSVSPSSTTDLTTGVSTAAGSAGTVPNFTLQEWSGAASAPLARVGMGFVKGDVPNGFTPVITGVSGAQFDQRVTWSDGSLKFAVAHIRDGSNFTANQSRSYAVTPTSGAFSNTGSLTLSGVLSGHDFKVNFSSVQTVNDVGTHTTLASGAFTASLSTHIATATRITKVHSGPVCEGWVVWGMARDNTSGVADAHLKTYWHVDAWKNADGSVYALEVAAVVALDWWSVANKFRLDYTATFVDGATTIQTYASVQHPYQSHWITCRTTADGNAGRRPWIGGAIPTLLYKPDRAYFVKSGVAPPLDLTLSPPSTQISGYSARTGAGTTIPSYVPIDPVDHRAAIDGTGGYNGRGVWSLQDATAFVKQTSFDQAVARVNAHVGLHVPYHYRSNRNRTRPGDSGVADIASTQINCTISPAWPSNFTADGMPTPVDAFADGRSPSGDQDGYVAPAGGSTVWGPSSDSSHAVSYSAGMYALEGEYYHLEAELDLANNTIHQEVSGSVGKAQGPIIRGDWLFPSAQTGVPSTLYSPIFMSTGDGQYNAGGVAPRGPALASNIWAFVAGLVPDDHVARNYFRAVNSTNGAWLDLCRQYTPASMLAAGHVYGHDAGDMFSMTPFMSGLLSMCAYYNFGLTESASWKSFADVYAVGCVGMVQTGSYHPANYRNIVVPKASSVWDATTNDFYAANNTPGSTCSSSSVATDGTVTVGQQFWEGFGGNWLPFANGDRVVFTTVDGGNTLNGTIPPEVTEGRFYFIRDVAHGTSSPSTFRVSATNGGAAITFAAANSDVGIAFILAAEDAYTPSGNGGGYAYGPGINDSYIAINLAGLAAGKQVGTTVPGVAAAITKQRAFLNGAQVYFMATAFNA